MKNRIFFFTLILMSFSFFNSCASTKKDQENDKFISQFFNNESVYNSLKDYYPQKDVIIYDEKKELVDIPKLFGIDSKKIKIETVKPFENYFTVYSFNLNVSLASIVLATSDGDKGIIYYAEKKKNKWVIMNIIPKNRY